MNCPHCNAPDCDLDCESKCWRCGGVLLPKNMPDNKRREECGDPVSTGEHPLMESSHPLDHDLVSYIKYKGYEIRCLYNRHKDRESHRCDMNGLILVSQGSAGDMYELIDTIIEERGDPSDV